MSGRDHLPKPSFDFPSQVSKSLFIPLQGIISGEFSVSSPGRTLGCVNMPGKVKDVFFSLGAGGKQDAATLSVAVDVKINGTSCLTTQPKFTHTSGESSTNKTTATEADDIVQAVIDPEACDVEIGDVLTYDVTVVKGSPSVNPRALAVVVSFEPEDY
jgi:hypothetical protein